MNRYIPDGWHLCRIRGSLFRPLDENASLAWVISSHPNDQGGAPHSPSDPCFLGLFIDDSICLEWQCISVLQALEIANSAKIPTP